MTWFEGYATVDASGNIVPKDKNVVAMSFAGKKVSFRIEDDEDIIEGRR